MAKKSGHHFDMKRAGSLERSSHIGLTPLLAMTKHPGHIGGSINVRWSLGNIPARKCAWKLGLREFSWMGLWLFPTSMHVTSQRTGGLPCDMYIGKHHLSGYIVLQASHLSPWQGRWMPKLLVEVDLFLGGLMCNTSTQHPCDRKTSNHSGRWEFPKMVVPKNGWFRMESPFNPWMIWGVPPTI